MVLRFEAEGDAALIHLLVAGAFCDAPHASGAEADIVDALRAAGALALSLVVVDAHEIVGHIAFSPVTVGGKMTRWFGLGPVAVARESRRQGMGANLIERPWMKNSRLMRAIVSTPFIPRPPLPTQGQAVSRTADKGGQN